MSEHEKKGGILLFVPMYNCAKQIGRVIEQLQGPVMDHIAEVILINNRSTDDTEEAAKEKIASLSWRIPVKVLRNRENYGLGGSHKVAFEYAFAHGYEYCICLHGDDQGSLSDFLPILQSGRYRSYDCCLGARFMKGSVLQGYSRIRIWGNYGFNLLFSLVARKRVYDLGSGLNLYGMASMEDRFYWKFPDTLYFNDCMILASCHYKKAIRFEPISWREEDQISNNKLISFSISLLKMLGRYIGGSKRYLTSEMRTIPRASYPSDVVYENRIG